MIPIFVGYDSVETIAWHTLVNSLITRSSLPLAITPIGNKVLPKTMWYRPRGSHDSTEFSNARFMVPALMGYQGWALFMDCDMVCLGDIAELWSQRDDRYAVMCVKHDHKPGEKFKFLGQEQATYQRKNWSSLMLLNCAHPACSSLTPLEVNTGRGFDLHRMIWAADDEIGELKGLWNVLVTKGHQHPEEVVRKDIKLLHFTLGGPWHGYEPDGSLEWLQAYREMIVGQNPCADVIAHQDEPGMVRFSGRFQRRDL